MKKSTRKNPHSIPANKYGSHYAMANPTILCTHICVVHCKSTVFLIFLLFENLANLTYVVPKEKIREDYEPVFVDKIKLLNVSCVMYSALY